MNTSSAQAAVLAAIALLSVSAHAQTPGAIALDQLEPTPAGDPLFGVPSPFIGGHLVPRALVMLNHAEDPLTVSDGSTPRDVVGSQSLLNVSASLALWDRLLVSALLPVALSQAGEGAAAAGGAAAAAPSSPAVGDLRLGARIRLLGTDGDPFQLGAGFYLHLPTGASDAFVGEGAVRDTPQLLLGGRVDRLIWSASAGAVIRGSENPSSIAYGGGAAVLFWEDRAQVGPEIYAATPIQSGSLPLSEQTRIERGNATSAEVLLGARLRPVSDLVLGAAAGPGLGEAVGTPTFRALGTVAWAPQASRPEDEAPPDVDEDGIRSADDACPYAHGPSSGDPKRHGCPVEDQDDDGVADPEDACPSEAGASSGEAARRGCPADADGDGVLDPLDACPGDKGTASVEPGRNGCPAPPAPQAPPPPADADGDGLLDNADACPREKGPASEDPGARGCPKRVRVQGDEVVLLEPIRFRVARNDMAPLDPASEPALEEIREVIAQHPEWVKIEVQAHTDDTGNAKFNETLSAARAEAVRKWLIDRGVPAERLVAKGYGPSKPIADNKTAAGREKNRRVQLVVLEKR